MPYKSPEMKRANNRKWRMGNPDYMSKYWRELRKKKPDKVKEYEQRKNKNKVDARLKLNRAVYAGKIKKPRSCLICGAEEVEAHHNDYSAPLEVDWLCRSCHLARHASPTALATSTHSISLLCQPSL